MKKHKGNKKPTMKEIAELTAQCSFGSKGSPLITSPELFPSREKTKVEMKRGDWVRCNRGPLRGAEGNVDGMQKISDLVTVIEVRQLNGNVIRLPRSHWEFAAFRGSEMHAE